MGGGRRLIGLGGSVACGLAVALALAACGGSSSSRAGCGTDCANLASGGGARTTNKGSCGTNCGNAGAVGAPAPAGASSAGGPVAQLGCHQYCRSAGGYGGGGGPSPPPAAKILNSGTVAVPPSGIVPVSLQCRISAPCRGAILVDFLSACNSSSADVGRSDLDVSPGSTRTIGVPLSGCQLGLLRQRGQLKAGITADTGASGVCKQYDCVVPGEVTLRSSG